MRTAILTLILAAAHALAWPRFRRRWAPRRPGSPKDPKVQVMWDRFYDHAAIGEIGRRLQAAHPNTCRCLDREARRPDSG